MTTVTPVLPRDLKPTIRKVPRIAEYRLTCPVNGCGPLGRYPNRTFAARAFDDHCDTVHPAPTPLDLVRSAVPLTAASDGQWTCEPVPGQRYGVRHIASGRYALSTGTATATVHGPLRSLAAAQLCIAQMAQLITASQAEAARLQLQREEKATSH
ncbi:hypothetical protein [Streptomyces sp. NPDC058268]|uniref:hypothetical protein n=1 Tax=Streptomyces sp. NPDC058268 TaxID=3346413 RepID=UPI0036EE4F93